MQLTRTTLGLQDVIPSQFMNTIVVKDSSLDFDYVRARFNQTKTDPCKLRTHHLISICGICKEDADRGDLG